MGLGVWGFWGFGVLGFWGFGVLGFWGFGVLGFWGFGVSGFWGFGVLGFWGFGVLGFWVLGMRVSGFSFFWFRGKGLEFLLVAQQDAERPLAHDPRVLQVTRQIIEVISRD